MTWSFGAWGQHLLASPRNQTIFAWTNDTAQKAHSWYHKHHVLGQEAPLTNARLALARATQVVLANGLAILGITAPDRM